MHLHTLDLGSDGRTMVCSGCDAALRLATYDEAVFVHEIGIDNFGGQVLIWTNNVVVVPATFSLFQEA